MRRRHVCVCVCVCVCVQVKTYAQLGEMVDQIFSPKDAHRVEKQMREAAAATANTPHNAADSDRIEAASHLLLDVSSSSSLSSSPSVLVSPPPSLSSVSMLPHAKLLPSTDADLGFNSFAFWRDEIEPIHTRQKRDGEPQHDAANAHAAHTEEAAAGGMATAAADSSLPAAKADGVPPALTADPSTAAFSHTVHAQVQAGSAEADAQAAVAEVIVSDQAKRDSKQ